jgi:dihydroorotase
MMAGTQTQRLWCRRAAKADLLIKGARVVDPAAGLDEVGDVLIAKGRVAKIGSEIEAPRGAVVREAAGCLLMPGFIDLHAHFRVPGREDCEDLRSVSAAAAAGGYVAAFGMANTDPILDNAAMLEGLAQRAQAEASIPIGFHAAVSMGQKGEQLTEMAELAAVGAVAFSDDGVPIASANLLRRALQYVKITGRYVAVHAQDASLTRQAVMHEGPVSARLGLGGMPSVAESIEVVRDLELSAYEDAPLHLCHVSTAAALEHLARFKDSGTPVTAEVTPQHLTLTDEAVVSLDPNVKMNPPLRAESDRAALVAALASGLVDCVATDHAPHCPDDKEVPFEEAPFGVIGLETGFAVLYEGLVADGSLELATLVDRMSQAPARIAGVPVPTVKEGAEASICLFDPSAAWTVDRQTLRSRSQNSPWLGRELSGRVVLTLAAGHIAWDAEA